jgi:RNA polymerase sigma factor (sigma-70 family)
MRIELNAEYDLLYFELREGDVERTEDLDDGVHMDLDAEGRVLGLEFLSLEAFRTFLERRGGRVEIPHAVKDEWDRQLQPRSEERETLEEALSTLTSTERTVLRSYYFDALRAPDVARELGITEATVRAVHHAALRKLRSVLAADEGAAAQRLEWYYAVAGQRP